jgi:hypothetical protein
LGSTAKVPFIVASVVLVIVTVVGSAVVGVAAPGVVVGDAGAAVLEGLVPGAVAVWSDLVLHWRTPTTTRMTPTTNATI